MLALPITGYGLWLVIFSPILIPVLVGIVVAFALLAAPRERPALRVAAFLAITALTYPAFAVLFGATCHGCYE